MKAQLKNKDTLFQVFSYEGKIINVPYPLSQCDFGKNPLEEISVANRFNGESVLLPRFAVAIYDVIMGSEALQDDKTMRKGLDFFIKYFPKQYMVLLD
jgi:hypothetical protein